MPKINQAIRLAKILSTVAGIRAAFTWRPFSVTAFCMLKRFQAMNLEFLTVIDGGSNIGQFARAASSIFPSASIFCFEPLPEVADRLRLNLRDLNRARVYEVALGKIDGAIKLRRNRYSLASSILPLDPGAKEDFPHLGELEELSVRLVTLDTVMEGAEMQHPVLLKLDLQGYELEALKGASKLLLEVDFVLVEVAVRPMYLGEPGFEEIREYLKSKRFKYNSTVDILSDGGGETLQIDALFEREGRCH